MHDAFDNFQYTPKDEVPSDALITNLIYKFTYKLKNEGQLYGFKARCSYRGNQATTEVNYDADDIVTLSGDRDSMGLIISITATQNMGLHHLRLTIAFLHEDYEGKEALCMHSPPHFDG